MYLEPGRLKDLVEQTLAEQSYVVCHETLPGVAPEGTAPAICRGFADRYSTNALRIIARLWGFVDVDPPHTSPFTSTGPPGPPTGGSPGGPCAVRPPGRRAQTS
jgi:hypothetical protein